MPRVDVWTGGPRRWRANWVLATAKTNLFGEALEFPVVDSDVFSYTMSTTNPDAS